MLQSLTTADFDEKVGSAEGVVVVKYGAEWCGACNDIVPVLEEVIATADVPFYEVDIDAEPELKTRAGVKGIPAVLFYKVGRIKNFIFGMTTADKIQHKLEMTKRS